MEIIQANTENYRMLVPLTAGFRAELRAFRGIESQPNCEYADAELREMLDKGYPIFIAAENGRAAGYIALRVEDTVVWAEHLYVCPEYRRKGFASCLFDRAEACAQSLGGDTMFNFVHPNNEGMIRFLRSKGYTVLNMIEIRKPHRGEKPGAVIRVNGMEFDY